MSHSNTRISSETEQALAALEAMGAVDLGAALDVTRNGSGNSTETKGGRS